MNNIKLIIFDLYGTLLQFSYKDFLREVVTELNIPISNRLKNGQHSLLITRYESDEDMIYEWLRTFRHESATVDELEVFKILLSKHLKEIIPFPYTKTLLSFLKNRGFKIGLCSNLAQIFIPPFYLNELDKLFDYSFFSCDIGCLKPETRTYQLICDHFDVYPEECLFIGDSKQNDFDAPINFGMNAFLIDKSLDISQLLWFSFSNNVFKSLLENDKQFSIGDNFYQIVDFSTLDEFRQGRYNIVAKVKATNDDGEKTFYCKRYLTPESAKIEAMAYELLSLLNMSNEEASLIEADEPLLMVSEAKGSLWEPKDLNLITAEQIGSYMAFSYIFANADIRPRNTFVYYDNEEIHISIIDLEHCFFDRALDLEKFGNPLLPQTADVLNKDEIEKITIRRSMSSAMTKRARKAFIPTNDEIFYKSFKKGFLKTYQTAKDNVTEIKSLMLNKIYQPEPLIIGTKAHRRAMSKIDVNDIIFKINEDAVTALDNHY